MCAIQKFGSISSVLFACSMVSASCPVRSRKTNLPKNREKIQADEALAGRGKQSLRRAIVRRGVPVAPAFPGILTFHEGETLTGVSTAVSSVYGVWEREPGRRNYSFAFISLRYNSTGVFIETQKVRQTVEISINVNEFTSTGTVEILDVNGSVIGNGCSTSTGTRFE